MADAVGQVDEVGVLRGLGDGAMEGAVGPTRGLTVVPGQLVGG